jgi:hypothetical protein
LRDIETDVITVAGHAFKAPQIASGLKAGKCAVEVRLRPLREVLARVLAEDPTPASGLQIATQEKLIALALVEGAERD